MLQTFKPEQHFYNCIHRQARKNKKYDLYPSCFYWYCIWYRICNYVSKKFFNLFIIISARYKKQWIQSRIWEHFPLLLVLFGPAPIEYKKVALSKIYCTGDTIILWQSLLASFAHVNYCTTFFNAKTNSCWMATRKGAWRHFWAMRFVILFEA